jgi:hypothetical protein
MDATAGDRHMPDSAPEARWGGTMPWKRMEISMKKRFCLALLVLSLAGPSAIAAETLEVSLGHSQVIGPVAQMSTVIVGNDSVADATLGGGGTIILTGKKVGATNLIVLDESGRELLASQLRVVPQDRRPRTHVRVTKGVSQTQGYVCRLDAGCTPVAGQGPAANAPVAAAAPGETTEPTAPPEAPETEGTASEGPVSLNP